MFHNPYLISLCTNLAALQCEKGSFKGEKIAVRLMKINRLDVFSKFNIFNNSKWLGVKKRHCSAVGTFSSVSLVG